MPTVLRKSGPAFERDGKLIEPRAMIHFCEDCGFEGAAFGETVDGKMRSWCGWQGGKPVCIGQGRAAA